MPARTSGPARRPTLKMVAERAGVSTATASYVLAGRVGGGPGASATTVSRVRTAAREIGYRPNQAARTVRTGRSDLVLLSLTMLADPWSQAVSEAVSAAAGPVGLRSLILADGNWADLLDGQPFDVAFVDSVRPSDGDRLRWLAGRGLRLIVFSDDLEPDGFDVINSPPLPGCELAVGHLLERHTRIGCLVGSGPDGTMTSRAQPYLRLAAEAGLDQRAGFVQQFGYNTASAYEAALRLLDRPDRPTAVYATTDFAAIAAINAAQRLGLSVPGDLAVVGAGNTIESERVQPSLTSAGPVDFFNRLADLVVGVAQQPQRHPPARHDFDWILHRRDSTGPHHDQLTATTEQEAQTT